MIKINWIFALLGAIVLLSCQQKQNFDQEIEDFNYTVGTQTVGAKYKFTDETNLVETAKVIKEMGSNLLKFSMSPRYWWENYDIPRDTSIQSLTQLAQESSMKTVLDMNFKYYHIWLYEFSHYTQEPPGEKRDDYQIKFIDGLSDEEAQTCYNEIYSVAEYLLKTYSGSGKVFFLGNWEGDWHLRWDYNRHKAADRLTLAGMTRWLQTRQKAIDDAKKNTEYDNVEMYHYVEVNLSDLAVKGDVCVTNDILPIVNPDFVSFSSYTATNPPQSYQEMDSMLTAHLNHIESKLPEKEGVTNGKRLFIGEYGWSEADYPADVVDERAKWVMRIALDWGCPFVLFWEMYNNELDPQTGENRGLWLINDKNRKTPLYFTHQKFYVEAKEWLREYTNENNQMPTQEKFLKAAAQFKSIK